MAKKNGFKVGDLVVYPAHGVGRIVATEEQEVAGVSLELYVVKFDEDRMTLRVPVSKADTSGMRRLSPRKTMTAALETLKSRARVRRVMWSRRAQEYEAKINSGDPISIAEVVRDLHRGGDQAEQSYSERRCTSWHSTGWRASMRRWKRSTPRRPPSSLRTCCRPRRSHGFSQNPDLG